MNKIAMHELINMVECVNYTRLPDSNITVCNLKLKSGFSAVGYSATLTAEYNEATAQQVSYENAIDTLWELEGYHRLSRQYEDSMLAQANTELWDSRELGADVEYTDLAPIEDDILLHALVNEDSILDDSKRWESSVYAEGNSVAPKLGTNTEPSSLMLLIKKLRNLYNG